MRSLRAGAYLVAVEICRTTESRKQWQQGANSIKEQAFIVPSYGAKQIAPNGSGIENTNIARAIPTTVSY